jgi:glutamine amidotransferase
MSVAIVNYGMGNLRSVQNAFAALGERSEIVDDPSVIAASKRVVLPGVGSFARAMENIRRRKLDTAIHEAVGAGAALLGICLGMQLLASEGDEDGPSAGLDLVPGRVVRMRPSEGIKIPHIGFNALDCRPGHGGLFDGLERESDFYFLHSFCFVPLQAASVIGTTNYGGEVVCAVRSRNVLGVQFHPEKSQSNGLRLLRNFLDCFQPMPRSRDG